MAANFTGFLLFRLLYFKLQVIYRLFAFFSFYKRFNFLNRMFNYGPFWDAFLFIVSFILSVFNYLAISFLGNKIFLC